MDSSFFGLLRQDLATFLLVPLFNVQFATISAGRRLLTTTSYLQVQVTYTTQDAANVGITQINSNLQTFNNQLTAQGLSTVSLSTEAQMQTPSSSSDFFTSTNVVIIAVVGGVFIMGFLVYGAQQRTVLQAATVDVKAERQQFLKIPPHLQVRPRNSSELVFA